MLSEQQIQRYSRQIILPELGGRGQQTLLSGTVAVVGSGALSTAAITYLAASGVGRLAVATPELQSELEALNPDCQTSPLPVPLTDASALAVAAHCDAVLSCGAPPEVCALLNTACVAQRTPLVWAETAGALGLIAVLVGRRGESPCYTCVAPHVPRLLAGGNAAHALAEATATFIGTLLVTETIKILGAVGVTLAARVLTYDAAAGTVDSITTDKNPRCPTCGGQRT